MEIELLLRSQRRCLIDNEVSIMVMAFEVSKAIKHVVYHFRTLAK